MGTNREDSRNKVFVKKLHELEMRLPSVFEKGLLGTASFGAASLEEFRAGEYDIFIEYLDNKLRTEIPPTNERFWATLSENLAEIFSNASIHSESEVIFVFSVRISRESFAFCVVDFGIGIRGRLTKDKIIDDTEDVEFAKILSVEAIEWALKKGNSTSSIGLGLPFLREFIETNKGKLHIISDFACWMLSEQGGEISSLDNPFGGTVIHLEIDIPTI